MTSIYNFVNDEIVLQKEQQILLFERAKTSCECHEYHFNNFMVNPTKENEVKYLKAFEFMTYDLNNLKLHQLREMEERLRKANELLEKHDISID